MSATTATGAKSADARFNQPGYDIVAFAVDFLGQIHAPVTPANVAGVVAWSNSESQGYNPHSAGGLNNPLNIVATAHDGHSGQGGSQGDIADFPDPHTGAVATAKLFTGNRNAAPIIAALRNSSGTGTLQAAVNRFYSSWGGSISFGGSTVSPDQISAAQANVGHGAGAADLTSAGSTIIGDIGSGFSTIIGVVPGLGGLVQTATLPGKLAGLVIGTFANWRYVLELFAGAAMILVGLYLIARDTGATQAVGNAAKAGAGGAAVVAAA